MKMHGEKSSSATDYKTSPYSQKTGNGRPQKYEPISSAGELYDRTKHVTVDELVKQWYSFCEDITYAAIQETLQRPSPLTDPRYSVQATRLMRKGGYLRHGGISKHGTGIADPIETPASEYARGAGLGSKPYKSKGKSRAKALISILSKDNTLLARH
eukprot:279654-Prymnesium_polylepis.1